MCVDWNNAVANNHALHGSLKLHIFHAPHDHAFAPSIIANTAPHRSNDE